MTPHTGPIPTRVARAVIIDAGRVALGGDLVVPPHASGVVVFAHGSGSGRFSPRNRHVAEHLNRHGLATLLLDLLTEDEERLDAVTSHIRFDIPLLSERLLAACEFVGMAPEVASLPLGLFGASTGAAAALVTASKRTASVAAVVSRGGRPDLAGPALDAVRAPTLLIVGTLDYQVMELNEHALSRLERIPSRMELVEGASHLFEEPGTLDEVAGLAEDWFERYLPRFPPRPPLRRPHLSRQH